MHGGFAGSGSGWEACALGRKVTTQTALRALRLLRVAGHQTGSFVLH